MMRGKRQILKEIDEAFLQAGEYGGWMYREYKNLYELGQLARFQIFDINWFKGASEILDLIDELHTKVTPKEDFVALAALLDLPIDTKMTRGKIAAVVKKDDQWRVKAYDLEHKRMMGSLGVKKTQRLMKLL